ncbi:hypothetical protein AB0N62_36860 [Streptomyces sp. NPDC093982]|uniref:hypothetical protein n=1 Tax=Streptomyces sp. NPDC093982 TaxID=3155077 RepID=UPI00343AF6E6
MKRIAMALLVVATLMVGISACASGDDAPDSSNPGVIETDEKAFKNSVENGKYDKVVQHVEKIRVSDRGIEIVTDLRKNGDKERDIAEAIAMAYIDYVDGKDMWSEYTVTTADGKDLIILPPGD